MTVIDFEGFVDGVAFEGGKGENYPLTIGSGSFIPGFEEALVGAELNKETEVNVTFPEDYHATELAASLQYSSAPLRRSRRSSFLIWMTSSQARYQISILWLSIEKMYRRS